jgi:RNA polymerase sigma-70 factor (ECF subfamily)
MAKIITIRPGNYTEFNDSVIPHSDALYNFALKMTKDEDDAQDLLQETLLKAYRFFDKFEKGTNIKAWLFMILKNTFINMYRKTNRQPQQVDYEDVQNFYENIKADEIAFEHSEEDVFSKTMDDEVTNAISTLQEDYRTVIILSDIEGYSYEEIAEFIDTPVGTVRSRLHRARKMLYTKLYNYAKERGYVKSGNVALAIA